MSKRSRSRIDRHAVHATSIANLSHEGRGIARIDGKTTFVFNALADETVEFQYRRSHRQYDEADAINILDGSELRTTPICQAYGRCGGCSLQHMLTKAQLAHKQQVFQEQLRQYAQCQPKAWLPPLEGPTAGYRRRARLSVREVSKKNTVMLGFRERDGRYVTDMRSCPVLDDRVGRHLSDLRDILCQLPEKAQIPQIEISVANEAAMIIRNLTALSDASVAKLINFCMAADLHLYLQPGNASSIHKVYPKDSEFLLSYALPDFNLTMHYPPGGFIQINDIINQKMLMQVVDLLKLSATDKVLDLFCGVGNISLALARYAKQVVGVEVDEAAVANAQHNAKLNNISNADFFVADLFADCSNATWLNSDCNILLLDPPRAGAQQILSLLPKLAADKIIYISCHPMTLARDAKIICEHGYVLECAGVMDMFPHTQHVESMAYFVRQE